MDNVEFFNVWQEAQAQYDKVPTESQLMMAHSALSEYSLQEVKHGIGMHIKDPEQGMYAPKPAHIIRHLLVVRADDGRPDVEEAWLSVPLSGLDSAVMTEETSKAFFMVLPMIDSGDAIASRMAFKEIYPKLVAESRKNSVAVKWECFAGEDKYQRDEAKNKTKFLNDHGNKQMQYLEHSSHKELAYDDIDTSALKNIMAQLDKDIEYEENERIKKGVERAKKSTEFFKNMEKQIDETT